MLLDRALAGRLDGTPGRCRQSTIRQRMQPWPRSSTNWRTSTTARRRADCRAIRACSTSPAGRSVRCGWACALRATPSATAVRIRYELNSPVEFVAVNLEYFLLDPTYACRRPALYRYFAVHFRQSPAHAACAPGLAYLQADTDAGQSPLLQLDPERVYAVDYLLAEGNDKPMSRWGHSMLRLVICAPGRPRGPDCRLDLQYHRVLSFRAFVDDVQISSWRGLTGSYPSRLFLLPLQQVIEEYTKVELRGLQSIPLKLDQAEIATLLERAAQVHWSYDGRYYFLGNNCAVETFKLLHDGVPRLAGERLASITPTGLLRRLKRAGAVDATVLDDPTEALAPGLLLRAVERALPGDVRSGEAGIAVAAIAGGGLAGPAAGPAHAMAGTRRPAHQCRIAAAGRSCVASRRTAGARRAQAPLPGPRRESTQRRRADAHGAARSAAAGRLPQSSGGTAAANRLWPAAGRRAHGTDAGKRPLCIATATAGRIACGPRRASGCRRNARRHCLQARPTSTCWVGACANCIGNRAGCCSTDCPQRLRRMQRTTTTRPRAYRAPDPRPGHVHYQNSTPVFREFQLMRHVANTASQLDLQSVTDYAFRPLNRTGNPQISFIAQAESRHQANYCVGMESGKPT